MTPADRRFMSMLFVIFGPLFVVGGFLVAFTDPGAVLVFFGVGMFAAGLLLRTPLPLVAAVGAGMLVSALLLADLVRERLA